MSEELPRHQEGLKHVKAKRGKPVKGAPHVWTSAEISTGRRYLLERLLGRPDVLSTTPIADLAAKIEEDYEETLRREARDPTLLKPKMSRRDWFGQALGWTAAVGGTTAATFGFVFLLAESDRRFKYKTAMEGKYTLGIEAPAASVNRWKVRYPSSADNNAGYVEETSFVVREGDLLDFSPDSSKRTFTTSTGIRVDTYKKNAATSSERSVPKLLILHDEEGTSREEWLLSHEQRRGIDERVVIFENEATGETKFISIKPTASPNPSFEVKVMRRL